MEIGIDFDPSDGFFANLKLVAEKTAQFAVAKIAIDTKENAIEIINQLIYLTPERGGYARTGDLRASINTFAVPTVEGWAMVIVFGGLEAPYAGENELGRDSRRETPASILARAQAAPNELIILEYGITPGLGLEPRPVFYPSWVMAVRQLPVEVRNQLLIHAQALGFA